MVLDVLGRAVHVDGLGDATRHWITDDWCAPLAAAGSAAGAQALDYRIELVEPALPVPERVHSLDTRPGLFGTRHVTLADDDFWIVEGDGDTSAAVHGRLADHGATLEVFGVPFTARFALQSALCEALAGSGLVMLHAAAIHHHGTTLALVGPSGRGKSTTLLRAVVGGWQAMAEDSCFLDLNTRQLSGFDRYLRLLPAALPFLRQARPDVDPGPLEGTKHQIPFASLGDTVASALLTEIVHLERSESFMPGWSEASPARTVMALYQAAGVPHTARVGYQLGRRFGELVGLVRCSSLALGDRSVPLSVR